MSLEGRPEPVIVGLSAANFGRSIPMFRSLTIGNQPVVHELVICDPRPLMNALETLGANAHFSRDLPVKRYFGSVKRACRNPLCCSRFANASRAARIAGRCSTAQLWSDRSGTISDLPRSVSS
ncbi:hypothetical protein SAMN05414139_08324 [Burkholderia sp. D7]|nr:hypothetical protein SAMN05414139_08324 [Burkholderia sp. D7]